MATFVRLLDSDGNTVNFPIADEWQLRQDKNSGIEHHVIDVVVPSLKQAIADGTPSEDRTFQLLDAHKLTPEYAATDVNLTSSVPAQEHEAWSGKQPFKPTAEELPGSKDYLSIPLDIPPTPQIEPITDFTGSLLPTPVFVQHEGDVIDVPEVSGSIEPHVIQDVPPPAPDADQLSLFEDVKNAVDKGEPFVPPAPVETQDESFEKSEEAHDEHEAVEVIDNEVVVAPVFEEEEEHEEIKTPDVVESPVLVEPPADPEEAAFIPAADEAQPAPVVDEPEVEERPIIEEVIVPSDSELPGKGRKK